MRIRPRMSQHEGRDAVTTESAQELSAGEVQGLALSMAMAKLAREGIMPLEKVQALVETLNTKYKAQASLNDILKDLEKAGNGIDKSAGTIATKGFKPVEKQEAERVQSIGEAIEESAEELSMQGQEFTELVAIPSAVSENHARKLFDKMRKKKLLGFLGEEERISSLHLKYQTVWKVLFNEYNLRKEFTKNECYVDSVSGEFLHYNGKGFLESKGAKFLYDLSDEELSVVLEIAFKKKISEASEPKFKRIAEKLVEKGVIKAKEDQGVKKYVIDERAFDLPPSPQHEMLSSVGKMRFVTVQAVSREKEKFPREEVLKLVQKLWPNIIVKKIEEVHRPVFEAVLERMNGEQRTIKIDAVNGKQL